MELTKCSNGHFYDADRFGECPYCNGTQTGAGMETLPYDEGTINTTSIETVMPSQETLAEQAKGVMTHDYVKTQSFYELSIGSEPVVGWLVCTEGNHVGESFNLKEGKNFIGRAETMDVVLSGDTSIAREKHAIILYEPKANIFMVQPGESRGLAYLNDNVILGAEIVKAYDTITLGQTKLTFVPFCSDKFKWDTDKKDEQEK